MYTFSFSSYFLLIIIHIINLKAMEALKGQREKKYLECLVGMRECHVTNTWLI